MTVVGTKLGTKAFGQTTEKLTGTANLPHTESALDADKIGGENIGDVLNKVADPNWVDPSKKMRSVGNPNLDKDAFFRLMLAQMKNQDPTNPLKPHEMSAQLANFSALEQMTNINQTLQEMKSGQKPTEQFQALSLIGKAVSGDSAKIVRVKGDKIHDIRFNLPMAANDVDIKIKNSAGDTVRTYSLKNQKAGANALSWNGLDDKGTALGPDEYTATIEAKAGQQKMAVKTDFEGVISGVNYTPEGPVLMVGNQTVRLRDLRKIIDPSLMKNDQKVETPTQGPLKNEGAPQQTEKESNVPAAPEKKAQSSILDNVGLSREMMSQVQKAMKAGAGDS